MAVRFLANAGRIIMSKAGYDAGAGLPDQFKLFDSDWMATGLVIATGVATKNGSQDLVINFPYPLHYEPAAYAYTLSEGGTGSGDGRIGTPANGYTTNSALVITGGGTRAVDYRYIIFAVSI